MRIFKLSILLIIGSISRGEAHQDRLIRRTFGNVTTLIKIAGRDFEEVKRVEIIGEISKELSLRYGFRKEIVLVFDPISSKKERIIQVDLGPYQFQKKYGQFKRRRILGAKKKIYIRQDNMLFNILATLNLIEHAILNHKTLFENTEKLEFERFDGIELLESIGQEIIEKIISEKPSEIIKHLVNQPWYRPGSKDSEEIRYFWKNDVYTIENTGTNDGKGIVQVSEILYFLKREGIILVYDTDSTLFILNERERGFMNIDEEILLRISNKDGFGFKYEVKHDQRKPHRYLVKLSRDKEFIGYITYHVKDRILDRLLESQENHEY